LSDSASPFAERIGAGRIMMGKFGTLIGRKPSPAEPAAEAAETSPTGAESLPAAEGLAAAKPASPATPKETVVGLDAELFFPIAAQLGEDNETVRNLLIDAEHRISQLEAIKRSISKLIDPVGKTLRALEEAKNERLRLQSAFNNSRLANSKLRNELSAAEEKIIALESEGARLRETLSLAQRNVSMLENAKAEVVAELTMRRAQVAELQRSLHQQSAEAQSLREENRRMSERIAATDKRILQLENASEEIRQKYLMAEKERAAVQAALDKALAELAQVSHRVLDTDKALGLAQERLHKAETMLSEAQAERRRLAAALDEANQKHQNELNAQQIRHETLQARAALADKLLEEARQSLAERAEEIRAFDRRLADSTRMHAAIGEKLSQLEHTLAERDIRIKELEHARESLMEQNEALSKAVNTRESAYNHAQEHIQTLEERLQLLESELKTARQNADMEIEELNAKLQLAQLERTMAEGALEAGRKDIARLLRELSALQQPPNGLSEAENKAQAPESPAVKAAQAA